MPPLPAADISPAPGRALVARRRIAGRSSPRDDRRRDADDTSQCRRAARKPTRWSITHEHFRLPALGLGAAADHRHHLPRGRARLRRASARRRHRLQTRPGQSFNPIRHIDPFGTILLPGMLLLSHSPFLFGYAKPVPVNFRALRNPRIGMVLVALAGPATNILLAHRRRCRLPSAATGYPRTTPHGSPTTSKTCS